MKLEYVKPRIFVERFTLTQSIAASCGVASGTTFGHPTSNSATTCAWDLNGVLFFTANTMHGCMEIVAEGSEMDGYCYNNPANMPAFFSSY